jgi:hypothetical protein
MLVLYPCWRGLMAVWLGYYRERGCTQGVVLGWDTGKAQSPASKNTIMKEGWPKWEAIT